MGFYTLFKKGVKKHMASLVGMGILFFIVSFALLIALSIGLHSGSYVQQEMERLGYGDLTAWVSGVQDTEALVGQIEVLESVEKVGVQPLIFAGYSIGDQHADSEGQLLTYDKEAYPYLFFTEDLKGYQDVEEIAAGTIYVSPSMQSTFGVAVGDTIYFNLGRIGTPLGFVVAGYFEDPFMGSSMIDRKTFLIGAADYDGVVARLGEIQPIDVLARIGAMVHVFQDENSQLNATDFNRTLNSHTRLAEYTEFVYTKDAIYSFMTLLQNMLIAFLSAFILVLLLVAIIVISHSIASSMALEHKNLGRLKTVGYTSQQLQILQISQYGVGVVGGIILALPVAGIVKNTLVQLMIGSTGVGVPDRMPLGEWLIATCLILGVVGGFIYLKTRSIGQIAPVQTFYQSSRPVAPWAIQQSGIHIKGLLYRLAKRQFLAGIGRYVAISIVAVVLVVFLSIVGRMHSWLGPNGEGLMDAFSAAAHDLGIQPLEEVDWESIEGVITSYSTIEATYELAMQGVVVEGVDYTANVIDDPSWFHLLSGRIPTGPEDMVVTDIVAKNLGISIGDRITVSHTGNSARYEVVGIYQCANEMGANIGMNKEGYARIGNVADYIWCRHYVLTDNSHNDQIMQTVQRMYRLEVDVHTNSWSGLGGIVAAMQLAVGLMYVIVAVFIGIVMALSSSKFLQAEEKDMAIYKSIGFTTNQLRVAFAIRFGIAVGIGALVGSVVSYALADRWILASLRLFGIGSFESSFSVRGVVVPPVVVMALFIGSAYGFAGHIKKVALQSFLFE